MVYLPRPLINDPAIRAPLRPGNASPVASTLADTFPCRSDTVILNANNGYVAQLPGNYDWFYIQSIVHAESGGLYFFNGDIQVNVELLSANDSPHSTFLMSMGDIIGRSSYAKVSITSANLAITLKVVRGTGAYEPNADAKNSITERLLTTDMALALPFNHHEDLVGNIADTTLMNSAANPNGAIVRSARCMARGDGALTYGRAYYRVTGIGGSAPFFDICDALCAGGAVSTAFDAIQREFRIPPTYELHYFSTPNARGSAEYQIL